MDLIQPTTDYQAIYNLLKAADFQHIGSYEEALPTLKTARNFMVENKAWIGYHNFTDTSCHVDVCAHPDWEGKWFSRAHWHELISKPLITWGLKELRIITKKPKLRAKLLLLGFKQVYSDLGECVLTHQNYMIRYKRAHG